MTNPQKRPMIELIGSMDSPKLRVHTKRCVRVRNRNASCMKCAEVCTTGAITRGACDIEVSPELCIGCGTCASACPSGCLEALNPADEVLSARISDALHAGTRHAVLACEQTLNILQQAEGGTCAWRADDGSQTVFVICLGRAEESLLLEAVARGAQRITLVSAMPCASCTHSPGGALCDDMCATAQKLLASLGSSAHIEHVRLADFPLHPQANAPSAQPAAPAEEALPQKTARPQKSKTLPSHYAHVQRDGTLPHHLPAKRLRLFNSLKRIRAQLKTPVSEELSARFWGTVHIDIDLCRSCRMCTVFCPTGALARFDEEDGTFGVEQRAALCTQCRTCETICPEQAITVSDTVSIERFLSGAKERFAMQPLDWNPNGPDSIATRMTRLLEVDALQDPQATMKPEEVSRQRAIALERQRIRDERRRSLQTRTEN